MADPTPSPHGLQESTSSTVTVVETAKTDEQDQPELPTLKLRLKKKPQSDRKVMWTTETVDNEHMNKKKSKCCCIYEKPRKFGESSSDEEDSDDECDHCKGHVEKKKDKHKAEEQPSTSSTPDDQAIMSES